MRVNVCQKKAKKKTYVKKPSPKKNIKEKEESKVRIYANVNQ